MINMMSTLNRGLKMRTSFSAISEWRTCQQSYFYTYVDHLVPKIESTAPILGRILHDYLDRYYSSWLPNADGSPTPFEAHSEAWAAAKAEAEPEIQGYIFTAQAAGEEQLGLEFSEMLPKAERIADRYFAVRGLEDSSLFEVVACEQKIVLPLDDGLEVAARVDLVTRDAGGSLRVWEHKSTGTIPPQQRRFRDLQVTLLTAILELAGYGSIDGVVWNYLRTKEPTVPALLKGTGALTTRSDLDSTWEVYQREIERNGFKDEDYEEVRLRLEGKEQSNFFPRVELPLFQSEHILLRDFIATAKAVKSIVESDGFYAPPRNIGGHCDWCKYSKLCEAVIIGGDDFDLKERLFNKWEAGNDSSTTEGSSEAPDNSNGDNLEL